MSAEGTRDYDISNHEDQHYEIIYHGDQDNVDVTSHVGEKKVAIKHDVVDNTIPTSIATSSYNVSYTEKEKSSMTKKCGILLFGLIIGIALLITACVALFALVQLFKLRSDVAILQSTLFTTGVTNSKALESIVAQFSKHDQLSADITRLVLDVAANLTGLNHEADNHLEKIYDSLSIQLSFINQVLSKTTDNSSSLAAILVDLLNQTGYPFYSCDAIQKFSPFSPSGYYHVKSSNGSAVRVYCDMTGPCGDITGGWMRVVALNMTDTSTQCPNSLELLTSPRRLCRAMDPNSTCSSDTFSVDGVVYSKVCGRIRAYQFGNPEGFGNEIQGFNRRLLEIGKSYVDGISLTHGRTSRQHIWTFAGGRNNADQISHLRCPCLLGNYHRPPPFVGEDYFCDTSVVNSSAHIFNVDDPLWDGADCAQNTCCSFNNPPWFHKHLPQPTTDGIEKRVCRDQERSIEDFAIEVVEIYVQ